MPELPEVELVARSLDALVAGRRIAAAKLVRANLAPEVSPAGFARRLRGRLIERVGRRGKHVLMELERGLVLLAHLRMTGRFQLFPPGGKLPKHASAVLHLEDGRRLVFSDVRQFGRIHLAAASELARLGQLRRLAPEPFSDEFSAGYLGGVLARTRRSLKEVLLDQTKVTGLGNIYAAEAMFLARANPFVSASDISSRRVPRLHRAIVGVLSEAIAHGSTMNVNPEDIEGSYYGGPYESRWRVYAREGEPCTSCRAPIRRVFHAGRSTYFCPRCQSR